MIQNELIVQSAALLKRLDELGYDILAEDDFSAIQQAVIETGKQSQSPMFSVARNDFVKGSAFWAFLLKDEEKLGAVAARYYDLKSETLESYLRRTSAAQYGQGQEVITEVARSTRDLVRGRLIYFGELEFHRKTRGQAKVLTAFSRLSMVLSAMTWPDFDWMYAFIPKEHARLADYYGFTYRLPRAVTWVDPAPKGRLDTHMLIALSAVDFEHLLTTGELSEF